MPFFPCRGRGAAMFLLCLGVVAGTLSGSCPAAAYGITTFEGRWTSRIDHRTTPAQYTEVTVYGGETVDSEVRFRVVGNMPTSGFTTHQVRVRIHDDAGRFPDTFARDDFHNPPQYNFIWDTYYNGRYTLTAEWDFRQYQYPGGPLLSQVSYQQVRQFTVLNRHAEIDPAMGPDHCVFAWDPAAMGSVAVSGFVRQAHEELGGHVRFVLQGISPASGSRVVDLRMDLPGRVVFDWDGRDDGGRLLPKGIFLYQVDDGYTGLISQDLRVSIQTLETVPSDGPGDGDDLQMRVRYSISAYSPPRASSGHIAVYRGTERIGSQALSSPGLSSGAHELVMSVAGLGDAQQTEPYDFVIVAKDSHSNQWVGGFPRVATGVNRFFARRAAVFGFSNLSQRVAEATWPKLANGFWAGNRKTSYCIPAIVTADRLIRTQPRIDKRADEGYYALLHSSSTQLSPNGTIWFYMGHGGGGTYSGKLLEFAGKTVLTADNATQPPSGYTRYSISNLPNGSCSKLYLAVLAACESGKKDGKSMLPDFSTRLRSKGAQNVITFNRVMNQFVASYWCNLFMDYVTRGTDPANKNALGIREAADEAQDEAVRLYIENYGRIKRQGDIDSFVVLNGQEIER